MSRFPTLMTRSRVRVVPLWLSVALLLGGSARAGAASLRGSSDLLLLGPKDGPSLENFEDAAKALLTDADENVIISNATHSAAAFVTATSPGYTSHSINVLQLQTIGRFIDANNDTLLSFRELQDFAHKLKERQRSEETESLLTRVDQDGSGDVDLAEIEATTPNATAEIRRHQESRFAAADSDGDGRLCLSQFHKFVHPVTDEAMLKVELDYTFQSYDLDASGFVDLDEYSSFQQASNEADFDKEPAFS